jgi:predicted membrane-bound spermidine synthase
MTRLLGLVFFMSGFASLMYQVAWQRILSTYYGVGAIATTLIVSVFLLGLGSGAVIGGRIAERVRRPLVAYVVVELALGGFGATSLSLLAIIGKSTAGQAYPVVLLCTSLFLVVPTMLMGATLPLFMKAFSRFETSFLPAIGWLYFVNTLGAALGSLFTSYVVISFYGLDGAVHLAALLNVALGVVAWLLARKPVPVAGAVPSPEVDTPTHYGSLGWLAYPLVFLSGALAIGYEIAWVRMHGVLLKSSPYAFSTVLAVYLLGIALGSFAVRRWSARHPGADLRSAFFVTQGLVGAYVLISCGGYAWLTEHTSFSRLTHASFDHILHPDFLQIDTSSMAGLFTSLYRWLDVLWWPSLFLLVPSVLMGAAFPLASSLALTDRSREGETIGTVYFWNVVGNVAGGVGTGFVLLPLLGTANTLLCFGLVSVSMLTLAKSWAWKKRGVSILIAAAVAVFVFPHGDSLYRTMHPAPWAGYEVRVGEGVDTLIVSFNDGPSLRLFIGGLEHGGRPNPIFHYEVLKAASARTRARDALVIGFGTGGFTEALLALSEVEDVTLVEISETLLDHLRGFSTMLPILENPKLHTIIEDGRRYLYQTERRFDLVFTDPLRTTTAGAGNLYSREFLQLIRDHLTEGGVTLVWTDELEVVPRTVATVFKYVRMFWIDGGTRAFCLASDAPLEFSDVRLNALIDELPEMTQPGVRALAERSLGRVEDGPMILERTRGLPVNLDVRPRSEYYLGLPQSGR